MGSVTGTSQPPAHPPLRAPPSAPPLCVPPTRPVPSGQESEVRPGRAAPRRGCRSRPAGDAAYPAAGRRLPGGEGRAVRSLDGTRRGAPGILGLGPHYLLSPSLSARSPLLPAPWNLGPYPDGNLTVVPQTPHHYSSLSQASTDPGFRLLDHLPPAPPAL